MLSIEFGTHPLLMLMAVPIAAFAVVMRLMEARACNLKTLIGLAELAPEKYPCGLVTGGIYSRIRHPHYVHALFLFLAFAVFSNYLAAYMVVLACGVWMVLVTRVEEKELRERFGAESDAYCARVPRFLPRL